MPSSTNLTTSLLTSKPFPVSLPPKVVNNLGFHFCFWLKPNFLKTSFGENLRVRSIWKNKNLSEDIFRFPFEEKNEILLEKRITRFISQVVLFENI
jgi:hypothetical protein